MALDAARLYHLRGLDQAAVAQVLHVSRPQVSKLLATARELGYIRTHVVDPRESDRELVQTLTQRFRIADYSSSVPPVRRPETCYTLWVPVLPT